MRDGRRQGRISVLALLIWSLAFLLVAVPLVPFRYVIFPDFVPNVLASPLQHAPVGVSLLVVGLWCWQRGWAVGALDRLPLGWPVGAVLLTGVVSSLGAEQPLVSTAKTLYYFLTGGLLYIVLVDLLDRRDRAHVLLLMFLGAAYIGSFYGILEFAIGHNILYSQFFTPENEAYRRLIPDPWFGRRIVGAIGHPVVLGSYLVLALPISLSTMLNAPRRSQQGVLLLGTLGVLGALLLSFTRGAWLAAAVAIGVYLKLRGTRLMRVLPVVALVLVVSVVVMVFSISGISDVAVERVLDGYENYVLNFTSTTRGAAYGYVTTIASTNPLMGLGTGMYRFEAYELRRNLDIPTPLGVLDTPDNMYLVWLAENGAIGLVAAVYVLASLFRVLWQAGKAQSDPVWRDLTWGFMAAFAGLCVDMLTVDALYFHVTRTVFWVTAGLAVVLLVPTKQGEDDGHS